MLTALLTVAYLVVALFAAAMTYDEQCQKGQQRGMLKALGFLACAVWPVTLLAVFVAVKVTSFEMAPAQASPLKDV